MPLVENSFKEATNQECLGEVSRVRVSDTHPNRPPGQALGREHSGEATDQEFFW